MEWQAHKQEGQAMDYILCLTDRVGGVYPTGSTWLEEEKTIHINLLELLAAMLAPW